MFTVSKLAQWEHRVLAEFRAEEEKERSGKTAAASACARRKASWSLPLCPPWRSSSVTYCANVSAQGSLLPRQGESGSAGIPATGLNQTGWRRRCFRGLRKVGPTERSA